MSFISALNNFAQGLDPTVTRLILGDFEFLGFEVPIRLAFPGKQKTVIHQMIGGKRTIDVLGTEYDPLTWTGTGALQDFIAGLSLGQLLPFTQLATIAYGASPLVTNVSSVTLNGSTSDLAASAKQVIRAGTITVS